jgi:hypothetical protein
MNMSVNLRQQAKVCVMIAVGTNWFPCPSPLSHILRQLSLSYPQKLEIFSVQNLSRKADGWAENRGNCHDEPKIKWKSVIWNNEILTQLWESRLRCLNTLREKPTRSESLSAPPPLPAPQSLPYCYLQNCPIMTLQS